jgi:hypothetical protein
MQIIQKQIINKQSDVVVVYTFDTKHEVSIWNNGSFFAYDKKWDYASQEDLIKLFDAISMYEIN